MNIQELEEMQHNEGRMTELENMFSQSRGETKLNKVSRAYVNWLSSLGFFVVICHSEIFCRWTDAFIGIDSSIEKITRCSAEALQYEEDPETEIIYPEGN